MTDKLLMLVKASEAKLTAERLRELIDYDRNTGLFYRKGLRSEPPRQVGNHDRAGYVLVRIDGKSYRAHRLAWLWVHGKFPEYFIDHINGVRDDNRLSNLRDVPRSINEQNQRRAQRNSQTGYLGVGRNRTGKCYHARIFVNKKLLYLGWSFKTPEEAHAAYLEAKRKYHEGCTV